MCETELGDIIKGPSSTGTPEVKNRLNEESGLLPLKFKEKQDRAVTVTIKLDDESLSAIERFHESVEEMKGLVAEMEEKKELEKMVTRSAR